MNKNILGNCCAQLKRGNNMIKKVMVTKGLRGKENPESYHEKCLSVVRKHYDDIGESIEITTSTGVYNDFDGSTTQKRLYAFGNTLMKELAICDEIVFMDDWENYDGCSCENFIAKRYNVKCVYLNSQEVTE